MWAQDASKPCEGHQGKEQKYFWLLIMFFIVFVPNSGWGCYASVDSSYSKVKNNDIAKYRNKSPKKNRQFILAKLWKGLKPKIHLLQNLSWLIYREADDFPESA